MSPRSRRGLEVTARRKDVLVWHDEGNLVPIRGRSTKFALSKHKFRVRGRGQLTKVSGEDVFMLQEAGQSGKLELRTSIELSLQTTNPSPIAVAAASNTTFTEPIDHSEYADSARIAGHSTKSVLSELRRRRELPESAGPTESRLLVAATALFRRDDKSAEDAAELVLQGHEESRFLIAALGGAGTRLTAELLAEILERGISQEQQQSALAALGRARLVPPTVVEDMLEYFDHPELGGAARLMTGAVAYNTRETTPETSKRAITALIDDLEQQEEVLVRADILRALGNAGALESIAAASESVASPDPIERAAAAEALRRVQSDVADTLLSVLAEDADPLVRRSALGATLYRDPTEILLPVVERVARVDGEATVRREAIRALVHWKAESSSARETLVWVSKHDPQPTLRKVAAEGTARFEL